jgi:uracil-DNA glycosylase
MPQSRSSIRAQSRIVSSVQRVAGSKRDVRSEVFYVSYGCVNVFGVIMGPLLFLGNASRESQNNGVICYEAQWNQSWKTWCYMVQKTKYPSLEKLLIAVRNCRACEQHLPLGPRPIVQVAENARILIVGQAPGARVHATGTPWNDQSGERLRNWLGIDASRFYDASQIAIIPMGYCYPGRGKSGDLPPRRECATLWLDHLLAKLPHIEVTLLIGLYAQQHFLGNRRKSSLTETVKAWREFAPEYLPLPHPSPRNIAWFQRNPWFEEALLPELQGRLATVIHGGKSRRPV